MDLKDSTIDLEDRMAAAADMISALQTQVGAIVAPAAPDLTALTAQVSDHESRIKTLETDVESTGGTAAA